MPATMETLNAAKRQAISAYKDGNMAKAKASSMIAATTALEIAETKSGQLRTELVEVAQEFVDLAKQCETPSGKKKNRRDRQAEADDNGVDPSDWIVKEKPTLRFDDVAGLDDVKQEIMVKMIWPFTHPELATRYNITTGGGVLLYGPPGTGKTMIAKAIAGELDATFFVISPAQLMSKWVGEAEQNVKKLFDAAQQEKRSIIFIDEIEALVPRRKSSGSTVMQRVVPQILQELEGFDKQSDRSLLFMGATNKPWMLDEAVMRPGRLDAHIYVPLPDAPARMKLLQIYFDSLPLAEDVNFVELHERLDGYSGADIKNISQRAAQIPFIESVTGANARPVTHADIVSVIDDIPPSVKAKDLKQFVQFGMK